MRFSSKFMKTGVASVVAVVAVMAVGASAASAVPATWSNTAGGTVWSGTLTLSYGASTATCPINNTPVAVGNSGSPLQGTLAGYGAPGGIDAVCTVAGQSRSLMLGMGSAKANKNGSAYSLTNQAGFTGMNPFYPSYTVFFTGGAWTVPVVNGSGATPTRITFSNTPLDSSQALRATGTLDIKKSGGGLITLL